MKTLHFSININAPREKVWQVMLDEKLYTEWTSIFNPESTDSFFKGSWEKGSKIQFLGSDKNGKLSGMTSVIDESRPYEFVSIHHLGTVTEGVEDTTSKEAKEWSGYENYTFKDINGQTELVIDVDVKDDFEDYFNEVWPKALQKLKELAEA